MSDFNTDIAESSRDEQRRMLSAQQMARLSKSMKVTHLSRMPYGVDRKGEQGLEYPSPMPVVRTVLSLVFLLLVALAAWLIHWNVIAILFVLFPIVGTGASCSGAWTRWTWACRPRQPRMPRRALRMPTPQSAHTGRAATRRTRHKAFPRQPMMPPRSSWAPTLGTPKTP